MIHSEASSPREASRDLREIREALREYETSELAGIAETLERVTSGLAETVERLEKPEPGKWVNHEQAAAYFGISKTALYDAVKEGAPRHRMVGNVYAYNLTELEGYFASK